MIKEYIDFYAEQDGEDVKIGKLIVREDNEITLLSSSGKQLKRYGVFPDIVLRNIFLTDNFNKYISDGSMAEWYIFDHKLNTYVENPFIERGKLLCRKS